MDNQEIRTGAKGFFMQLTAVIALYVSFGSLVALVFNFIDYLNPDILTSGYGYNPYSAGIRFAISMLIIVFPLYLVLLHFINHDLRDHSERRELSVRKWLTYLTIFLAGAIVVGDLIALVNTFLNGEITARFIYKVLTLLVISGLTLSYYIDDIRGRIIESIVRGRVYRFGAIILVFGSIISGFVIIGSPQTARQIQLDDQRVYNLQELQSQIVSFWQDKQKLPGSLSELKNDISGFVPPVDPENGKSYAYSVISNNSFKLCANFLLETPKNVTTPVYNQNDNWQHGSGEVCFTRTIDPDIYPPTSKTIQKTTPVQYYMD